MITESKFGRVKCILLPLRVPRERCNNPNSKFVFCRNPEKNKICNPYRKAQFIDL